MRGIHRYRQTRALPLLAYVPEISSGQFAGGRARGFGDREACSESYCFGAIRSMVTVVSDAVKNDPKLIFQTLVQSAKQMVEMQETQS